MVKIVDGWIWENKSVAKRGSYVFSCPASLDMDEYFLCELFTKLEQVCATGLIHQLFSFSSHLFFFFFKRGLTEKKPNVLYIFTTNDKENKFTLLHPSSQICEPQVGKFALLT